MAKFPWITIGVCVISVLLFIGFHVDPELDITQRHYNWGSTDVYRIWGGHYWGVISCNFLHVSLVHLLLNLNAMFYLGSLLEQHVKRPVYIILILTSCIIVSSAELVISNQSGIGLSGILYAVFGVILFNQKKGVYPEYLSKNTVQLLIGWLFLCVILTKFKVLNIGNAAHFSGFIWGLLIGWILHTAHIGRFIIGVGILGLSLIPFYAAPWSVEWLSAKGLQHHEVKDLSNAKNWYNKALSKDSTHQMSRTNLNIILQYEMLQTVDSLIKLKDFVGAKYELQKVKAIDSTSAQVVEWEQYIEVQLLSIMAFDLHSARHYSEALKKYEAILAIDSNNDWAKKNMKLLP